MKIHQPMLFLGLGGTGCRVGRELERVLREALCGPDGTELVGRMRGHDYLPYQLPPCLQFVYADLSINELSKVLPY
ncbi:MAG: tubulin-like doman-containing protein, partial [Pseudonocardiaceae bacterium]